MKKIIPFTLHFSHLPKYWQKYLNIEFLVSDMTSPFLCTWHYSHFLKMIQAFILSENIKVALMVKNLLASAGDTGDVGSIPGSGRSRGGGCGNPLQYSCLENPMDRGAWWAMVHRVAKSWTWLSAFARTHVRAAQNLVTPNALLQASQADSNGASVCFHLPLEPGVGNGSTVGSQRVGPDWVPEHTGVPAL